MKNQFLLFLCLLFSFFSFSQMKYSFDYMIEFDFQLSETEKNQKVFFLTNSRDNSYFLQVNEEDNLNYKLFFLDNNGLTSTIYVSKEEFKIAESFTTKCEFVSKFENPFKYQVENYYFENRKDTLVDKEICSLYILRSNDISREKKNKLARNYYFVEKNTDFHIPLLTFSTAYEEYKLEKNIPNGIIKLLYTTKHNSQEKSLIYHLKSFSKINKVISVPKECSYKNP